VTDRAQGEPRPTSSDELPALPEGVGPLCLVGGGEWSEGCSFDEELWSEAGEPEVVVLPTAAAYEHPERQVETARAWFGRFGATVRPVMALARPDASNPEHVAAVEQARFVYLGSGSPLHLRSVLKDTPLWAALARAWAAGAVVAGSAAGAMVLGDPMVDPRGGALTLGLGLIHHLAIFPHSDIWSQEKAERTVELATGHLRIVAVDERTALIRAADGSWRSAGAGRVVVYVDGRPSDLGALVR
jgi:cyanophycinase